MAFVDPQALAPLLPIGPDDLIFPYNINLDSTFQEPNASGVRRYERMLSNSHLSRETQQAINRVRRRQY